MLSLTPAPKKLRLPHRRGNLCTPVERLMNYYAKAPDVRIRARKPKTCGKRTKLGLTRFLFEVFHQNELLPRKDKLTNEKIAAMLLEEFPNQESLHRGLQVGGPYSVNYYRNKYNTGTLIKDVFPDRCSFRYNSDGLAVEPRVGRRLLSVTEQKIVAEKFRSIFLRRKRPTRPLPELSRAS